MGDYFVRPLFLFDFFEAVNLLKENYFIKIISGIAYISAAPLMSDIQEKVMLDCAPPDIFLYLFKSPIEQAKLTRDRYVGSGSKGCKVNPNYLISNDE